MNGWVKQRPNSCRITLRGLRVEVVNDVSEAAKAKRRLLLLLLLLYARRQDVRYWSLTKSGIKSYTPERT